MELTLTKRQTQNLNKKGLISASVLQKAYKQSVLEQQQLKKEANKIRKTKSAK